MTIEYEATFTNIDKDEMRERLKKAGAKLVKPEFVMKRSTFDFPEGHGIKGGWIRIRNEEGEISMTMKIVDGDKIENQKEVNLKIDDYAQAEEFLSSIGCKKKSYQENKREMWDLDGVEVDIDEWPYLEPYVEVEGESEEVVKKAAEKLGFDYSKAMFGCVTTLYHQKYGVPEDVINFQTPLITFHDPNPFEKYKNEEK